MNGKRERFYDDFGNLEIDQLKLYIEWNEKVLFSIQRIVFSCEILLNLYFMQVLHSCVKANSSEAK